MLALVILGMAAAGVLLPFSSGAMVQSEGMHRTLAAQLANDLMEQIVADDNVLSWNGHTEAQGQVTDVSGAVFTDPMYAGFSRTASCAAKYVCWQPPAAANFAVVTVTVRWQGREIVTLSSLVGL